MDAYRSEPVRTPERFGVASGISGRAPGPDVAATTSPVEIATFDAAAVLERLDSDRGLLRTVADIFWEESPRLLADLRRSATARSPKDLAFAAHAMKGALMALAADRAAAAAARIEHKGRTSDLDDVEPLIDVIEAELGAFRDALDAFLSAGAPSAPE